MRLALVDLFGIDIRFEVSTTAGVKGDPRMLPLVGRVLTIVVYDEDDRAVWFDQIREQCST